ncbi:MAG TPA: MFS transporter [Chitinophagaceae bacterium]|nr:MFS transporter [Chitinophagaceae bacterium]
MNATKAKHPKALPYLFLTEMWERFGYYLMLGIFVLYMTDVDKGGLAMDDRNADDIFGTFIALVYLTPFIGGFLADRLLGYTKSIYLGGVMMGLGYMGLAMQGMLPFYISLMLIIVGNGFFKPSISTLLGNLYSEPEYKENKDAGYNIFYMGINIGALICNFFAAFMRNKFGWHAAFITAGVGMFLGLIIFSMVVKHIKQADQRKPVQVEDMSISKVITLVLLPAIGAGILGWFIPDNLLGSDSTDAFIFACLPVIIFFVSLYVRANEKDKRPVAALLVIFALSIMFWAVFKQNGTALTRWAKYYTDRELPATIQGPAETLYLTEKIPSQPDVVTKYDEQFRAVKENGRPVKHLGLDAYYKNLAPEKIPTNGQPVYLTNTELYQSVNPGWVVLLTPVVVAFFVFMRRRKLEPSTPAKIAWGLLISALSTIVMVGAVAASQGGLIKVSPWWLIGTYGVITVGELFLSPMGLSLVSKLCPPRITALMMGGFFLSTSIGNKLSGVLASMWYDYEDKANFFWVNCVLLLLAAALAFMLLKWMNQIFREQMH